VIHERQENASKRTFKEKRMALKQEGDGADTVSG
jgi:hypothetical protein